ncbi:MAG: hypothetical protein K1X51_06030 [Rhodospirillaceae bacterium]|nr:hypothetical protein [Rhodospirillaceae bacterium]
MNRHKRRAAAKQAQSTPEPGAALPQAVAPVETPFGKPGLVLRMFAKILLSDWVLKRVHHPDVRRALASLAAQAGRLELAQTLRR